MGEARRRPIWPAVIVGAVVLALVGAFLAWSLLGTPDRAAFLEQTVARPQPGEVLADHVGDHPVFVIGHVDGTIEVLDAVSPHAPEGQRPKVLAWCRSAEVFEDLWSSANFDLLGNWIGGPSPTSLARWVVRGTRSGRVELGRRDEPRDREDVRGPGRLEPKGDLCAERTALYLDDWLGDPDVLEDLVLHEPRSARFRYPTPTRVVHGPR